MFENIRADLRAHKGHWMAQGFWALVVYRFGRWRYGVRPAPLRKVFSLFYKLLYKFIQVITGIELPCEVDIGRNFVIDHHGGIVVSGYARFGDDCRIRTGVVVGLARVEAPLCALDRQQRGHRRRRQGAGRHPHRQQRLDRRECRGPVRCPG
jgi:serine O-acetyltransferase